MADDARRYAAVLPRSNGCGALAEVGLREADRRLSVRPRSTVRCIQNRARLIQALYSWLDRLAEVLP
ncbi:hypothetical protein ACFC34_37350 [Streptomyces sp. NPDC056053]|uniref:hypothetical protein n=1 Tax=Streptomyces sp. NPDC056053 TaxID=3345696 RepID=UPI0035D64C90